MELLPYLIAGLVTGSIYGLTATGLVLTYKTSAVFNFGHGATAAVAAFLYYSLTVTHGMSWPLAAVISVLVLGPVMGLGFELLARSLTDAPLVSRVTATVGVLIVVQAALGVAYGSGTGQLRQVEQFLPTHAFHVGDTIVRGYQLIIIAITAIAAVSLWLFFRVTRTGVAMRAVVDNADLLDLSGTDPVRVRRLAWMIGTSFACASGVLLAPLLAQLNAINLTFMVVTAFGAAAIGGFTNIPMTYVGGLAIGIGQALLTKYFTDGFGSGLAPALPFLVLFVVLLVMPKRRLVERQSAARLATARRMPWPVQAVLGIASLVVLLLVPSIFPDNVNDWSEGLAYMLVFLSLGLLVRTSGQVSLAHVSFMAIGAAAMSHLAVDHGVNWWVAMVLSALIAVPIGVILAIPAIRLSGLYLALATFGFGILLQYMFYAEDYMFGSFGLGLTIPRPSGFEDDTSWYYLMVALAAVTALGMLAVTRSRLGRLLRSMTDSPTGLSTAGASINVTRVLVFCLSAFIASGAGALHAATVTFVTGDNYQPILSLILFVTVVVSFGRDPWYAVIAAFVVVVLPTLPLVFTQSDNTSSYITIIIGLLALFIGYRPAMVAFAARLPIPSFGVRRAAPEAASETPTAEVVSTRPAVRTGSLEVSGLRVQFGGLVAVDGVTISAPTGRITGLIGPNGAGKTTTFNACSGLNRPTTGTVVLDGSDAGRLGPSARARKGLGRTFQQMELFDSMTVRENIAMGAEASRAGANPFSHLMASRSASQEVATITAESIALCGLEDIAHRTVGALSTGQRRLVEIARCLAGPFHLLLLDEPSSGLDRVETERFAEVLTRVVEDRGVGILIVEHDMSLVTSICDYVYVLDFGKPVFEGTASEVMAAPIVKAAYLGGDELEAELDVLEATTDTRPGSPTPEEVHP
ncbi:branched-chain amino acid ABC transporter permease/ATP-binding protein [Nocardioides mangrovi]|uniref:ATP-binding cassette domain-containing protein n=1 Tax=Nocardioides mangrovi TaxID=2874580 RepID=A0ABS7UF20_9ACTN|nr:branched-chain amino acid ABC transporter permease/ATP-binding protein [Nocardioides mangrovi]MBZ5739415.1 ATP-binding cassette domain-containing protein [Nocardioides mangrovi]